MAKLSILAGTTSKLLDVFIQDSSKTDGSGLTGLTSGSSGLTWYYYREGDASATQVTAIASMTLGTWTSKGFIVIDGTNMPGCYQLGAPDAALAAGAKSVIMLLKGVTNMAPLTLEIELTAVDNQNATTFGLTNLDAAISTRMATYTQPTGFLSATFPSTVASTTNITAGTITTVTNLTNAPTSGDFTATMKTSLNAATPAVTVSDKTGFSLTSAYDFAKGTVAMTESYAANGVAPSPVQAIYAIQQYLMDFSIVTTSYTVKKLDNATTAYVVTLNDATTPTAAART